MKMGLFDKKSIIERSSTLSNKSLTEETAKFFFHGCAANFIPLTCVLHCYWIEVGEIQNLADHHQTIHDL